MEETILQEIGLTQNESRVYLSLLKTKAASATVVAQESKIHRVNVYDTLEKLKERGLVSELTIGGKRIFSAANPENITNILKEKEIKLKTILPQLQMNYVMQQKDYAINLYKGTNALRKRLLRFAEYNKPIYAWGIPKNVVDVVGKTFVEEMHQQRVKRKQWMYHIYNSDAKERMTYLNTLPYTKAKYLPEIYDSPVETNLCGDELLMIFPGEEIITVSIMNKALANAYEKYFWLLWEKTSEQK